MPAKNYPSGWHRTRARILKRDSNTCHWCGADAYTVDHLVPIKTARDNGWPESEIHAEYNLAAACAACNYSRADRVGPPKQNQKTRTAAIFGGRFTPSPPVKVSLSPVSPDQGSLWDLSEGAARGNA